jgi:hypothetical protein
MTPAIKRCPNVIQLPWQWHTDSPFLSPDNRYVNNDAAQIEEYASVVAAPKEVEARSMECTVPVTILNLAMFDRTYGPVPTQPLGYLRY